MEETQIAEALAQNVPKPEVFVPAVDAPPDSQSVDKLPPTELDELTMFKMHDYFGEAYKSSNEDNKKRLQFIYDSLSEQLGDRDYLKVMSRVSDLEQMIGAAHSENRIYRLYQWIGLDNIRRRAETAMRLVNG